MINKLKIAGMAAKTAGRVLFKPAVQSKLVKDITSRTIRTGKIGKLRISKDLKNVYGTETDMKKGIFNYAMKTRTPQGVPTRTGFARGARETVFDPKLGKYTTRKAEAGVRGGLSQVKSWKDIRVSKRLSNVKAQHAARSARQALQTVDTGDLSKGYQTIKGHHNLPIELGDAITTGMKKSEIPQFWKEANSKFKHIFSGDHWGNMRLVPEGKGYKHLVGSADVSVHDQTHKMLTKYGISKDKLVKLFKGKNKDERMAELVKLDKKMKRMDEWIFLRMKKWKGGEEQLLETMLGHSEIRRMWPNISKAERRVKIKEWLANRRLQNKKDTDKALKILSKPLDQKALDSIKVGTR
jgi:hypothetical protein